MKSVKERVSRRLLMDDRLEAIALVEDEIGDLVERIYRFKAILPKNTMSGNACMPGTKVKGYLIKMDNGEVIYLNENSYKGYSSALYEKAQDRDKEEAKYCIHAFYNYIKNSKN